MYIKIENFNAHEVSELEIQEDSLTVITGVNDHGKSSVLQALYWVVTDGIMGDKFIHFGKDFTAVTVSSDENDRCMWSIRKERILAGKTIFTVIVNGEKNIYFKNEVPEVVIRLFGLKVLKFMKEEVNMNFWFQHDNFFLLSESAAYNAQFFGIFADTEVLDKLVGKFKSDTMNYTKQQKVDIDSSLKIRKQLDKLSTVDILRTQVVLLEKQALRVQSLKDKIKRYITITEQRQTNLKNLKIIKVYLLKYYKAYYSISTLKNQMLKLKSKYLKKDILDNYSRLHSLIQNKAWELHSKLLNKNRINLLGERLLTTRGIVGDINNMCNLRLELLRSNKEFTGLSLKHQRYIKIVDRENILAAASTKVKILKVLKLKRDLDNQTNTLILKQDKSILITNFEENLKSLNTVKETIKKLKVAAVDLMMATQNKDRNTAILKNHKDTQNLYETKLQDFKKEFSICPLCGTHLEGGLK